MPRPPRPATVLRRASVAVTSVALAVLIVTVVGDDGSTTGGGRPAPAQGSRAAPPAGPDGRLLRAGNAVVVVGSRADARQVDAIAERLGTPDRPSLRAAGQAVVVRVRRGTDGAVARVGARRLAVRAPTDPRLVGFLDRGLGG